jgi:hypothetical protein
MKGIEKINVRFFIYDYESEEVEIKEVSESEFLETEGEIEYERNTVFDNGCRQICLTKRNGY